MPARKMQKPRIVTFKMEEDDYEVLRRWWGFKGILAGDRMRELVESDIKSARQFIADVEGN